VFRISLVGSQPRWSCCWSHCYQPGCCNICWGSCPDAVGSGTV